jgi:hypothetical protein
MVLIEGVYICAPLFSNVSTIGTPYRLFGIVLAEANHLLFQRFSALLSWRLLLCSADCSDIPIGASVYLGLKFGFEIALRI